MHPPHPLIFYRSCLRLTASRRLFCLPPTRRKQIALAFSAHSVPFFIGLAFGPPRAFFTGLAFDPLRAGGFFVSLSLAKGNQRWPFSPVLPPAHCESQTFSLPFTLRNKIAPAWLTPSCLFTVLAFGSQNRIFSSLLPRQHRNAFFLTAPPHGNIMDANLCL